jgi:cellulose synthase/poly-beta-1,6-N-acetylglucosamine synthase-like glycosyltransferase
MTAHPGLYAVVYGLFVVCLVYTAALYAFVVFLVVNALREARERREESAAEDFDALESSRFTIPVSVIVPAWNEEVAIVAVVGSLLAQNYSEYEVIVVSDGSTDRTVSLLVEAYGLEPIDRTPRQPLPHARIRTIYGSARQPRLTLIDKDNGGKADALNAGCSYARYRYVCCVDGDTAYFADALARAMRPAMQDPGSVVGVSSLFIVSRQPETEAAGDAAGRPMDRQWLTNFQYLDLLRSFLCYRLAWSRMGFMLCMAGAFSVWRRDAIFEAGGFSPEFSCEDIELTFRIHELFRRQGRPCRILTLPDLVGATEGPSRPRDLAKQRVRWQRVVVETVWAYRGMLARPRYGSVAFAGMPYYVLYEALAPFFQAISVIGLGLAIWLGILRWPDYLYFTGLIVFSTAIPTTIAVYLALPNLRGRRLADVARLLWLGPLDFFLYRPILLWAGVRGLWGFLRGEKAWGKLTRNVRTGAA